MTPLKVIQNSAQCRDAALFFHNGFAGVMVLPVIFFAVVACVLAQCIRATTPGVTNKPKDESKPPTSDFESTSIPETIITPPTPVDDDETEQPPPYQPPTSTPESPVEPTPPKKRSSADLFVLGTFLLTLLLTTLFLLALTIQSEIYCEDWSPLSTIPRLIYWTLYTCVCVWCSFGFMCWVMLLRDLWGPKAKERVRIEEYWLAAGVVGVVVGPVIAGAAGAVKMVEWCQGRWCSDALEDEEVVGAQGGTELEEGRRLIGGEGEGHDDGDDEGQQEGNEMRVPEELPGYKLP